MGTMKILILHGWTYSLDKWKKFIDILDKKGFDTQILNIPGLTAASDEVWDLEKYVKWLNERVRKYKKEIILVGHSNGGRIAIAYTAKYPKKIKQLVLINSAGILHHDLMIRIKRLVFRTLADFGKKVTNSEKIRKLFYKFTREKDYEKATLKMRQTMVNLIKFDIRPLLGKIETPTLIIWGKEDRITPVSDGVLIHKLIKNSKLKIISGSKHSPFSEKPEKVAEIIREEIIKPNK